MGVYWLPFLFVGLLESLLMAAHIPPVRVSQELPENPLLTGVMGAAVIMIDILLWVLLLGSLVTVVVAYL
jgi:hypothetical protein